MPNHVRRRNATKSKVRARVEHVFAQQKAKMGLFIRTIGIKCADTGGARIAQASASGRVHAVAAICAGQRARGQLAV